MPNRPEYPRMMAVSGSLFCALLLAAGIPSRSSAQTFAHWGELRPGPYAVGFRTIATYDYSRTLRNKIGHGGSGSRGERARPIHISIWYPANPAQRTLSPLRYESYVFSVSDDQGLRLSTAAEKKESVKRFAAKTVFRSVAQAKLDVLMQTRTAAFRDAPPRSGRFPLLIFGQGLNYESPVSHSILCEYLASHGYVVAGTPYFGSPLPQSPHDLIGLEGEVRDMEFLIGYMRALPNVDRDRLAAIGFDFGGMAALLLQMRNTDVDAVVSLDSGIMFQHNTRLLKQSPYYNPANLRVPLMQVTTPPDEKSGLGIVEDLSLFESAKYSNTYLVRIAGMDHEDFTSYGMIWNSLRPEDPASRNKKSGYEWACRYVLDFLDAYLKKDSDSLARLRARPEARKAPLTVETAESVAAPPTEREFVALIQEAGVGAATEAYRKLKAADSQIVLFKERTLNSLGYQFLGDKRLKDAVDVFRLNVEAYPESSNAYDSLAEAYLLNGDKEMAIRNYRRSLELDPSNTNAVETLRKLTGK